MGVTADVRHSFFPYIEGISERTYTDEQLAHIDDGLEFDFEGKHYTAYKATQMQRSIERAVRDAKRKMAAFKAAGCKDAAKAQETRLASLKDGYRRFSKKAKLPEQWERTKVAQK